MSSVSGASPTEGGKEHPKPEERKPSSLTQLFAKHAARPQAVGSWDRFGYPTSGSSLCDIMRKLTDPEERKACMRYSANHLGPDFLAVLESHWPSDPHELRYLLLLALKSSAESRPPLSPFVRHLLSNPPSSESCDYTEVYHFVAPNYPQEMKTILKNGAITETSYLLKAIRCFGLATADEGDIKAILPKILPYLPTKNRREILERFVSFRLETVFSTLNPRPVEGGFETSCGKITDSEMEHILTSDHSGDLLRYLSFHPELEDSLATPLKEATERLIEHASNFKRKEHFLDPFSSALNCSVFAKTCLKHKPLAECALIFVTLKSTAGMASLMRSPAWLRLSDGEKQAIIQGLPLPLFLDYDDDELATLLAACDDLSRIELVNRNLLIHPEACSQVRGLDLPKVEDLQGALAAALKEPSTSPSRALSEKHATIYGSQGIYERHFALGKAQALWGISEGRSWEEILLALAHRRSILAFAQETREAPLFGIIRTERMETPFEGYYPSYQERAKEYSMHPPLNLMVYPPEKPNYPLTEVTAIAWHHLNTVGGDLHHPLMERFYELCEAVKDPLTTKTPESVISTLAEAHWLFANIMPFHRGSAMIMEMLSEALLESRGITYKRPPKGQSFDCEALLTRDIEAYKAWYHTVITA